MLIVLTGATGCLGRALVPELVSAGHEVVALVRPGNEPLAGPGGKLVPMDLGRPLDVGRLPARCDAVVHVAQSREYRKFQAALDVFRINTAAAIELASYASGAGARSFFYASTGTLYNPSPAPIPENGAVAPSNFHAASKLAAEQLLAPFAAVMAVTIGRLFWVYGPGQHDKLFNDLEGRLKAGKAVDLYGQDGLLLAPSYSGDVAQLVRRALEERWSGTYNMATPEVVTLRALTEEMGRVLGLTPVFTQHPGSAPVPVLPDLAKLKRHLTGREFMSLRDGLRQTFLQPAFGHTGG